MNTHYEGVKIDAQYGMFNHSNHNDIAQGIVSAAGFPVPTGSVNSGFQKNFSFVAGSNFADGKGNATVYATYDKQAGTSAANSTTAPAAYRIAPRKVQLLRRIRHECRAVLSLRYGSSGNVFPNQTVDPKTGLLRPATAADHFNFGALNFFQRPAERWTAGSFIHYDVNEHTTVYNEFMFMRNDTTWRHRAGRRLRQQPTWLNCGAVGPGFVGQPADHGAGAKCSCAAPLHCRSRASPPAEF